MDIRISVFQSEDGRFIFEVNQIPVGFLTRQDMANLQGWMQQLLDGEMPTRMYFPMFRRLPDDETEPE